MVCNVSGHNPQYTDTVVVSNKALAKFEWLSCVFTCSFKSDSPLYKSGSGSVYTFVHIFLGSKPMEASTCSLSKPDHSKSYNYNGTLIKRA